jgi:hypothetical protein
MSTGPAGHHAFGVIGQTKGRRYARRSSSLIPYGEALDRLWAPAETETRAYINGGRRRTRLARPSFAGFGEVESVSSPSPS